MLKLFFRATRFTEFMVTVTVVIVTVVTVNGIQLMVGFLYMK